MIVSVIIISALVISTSYFAYSLKTTKSRLQDYVAKYESVKVYAEGVAKQTVAVPVTVTSKKKVTKKASTAPVPATPAKRGRKPKTK